MSKKQEARSPIRENGYNIHTHTYIIYYILTDIYIAQSSAGPAVFVYLKMLKERRRLRDSSIRETGIQTNGQEFKKPTQALQFRVATNISNKRSIKSCL